MLIRRAAPAPPPVTTSPSASIVVDISLSATMDTMLGRCCCC